MGRTAQVKSWSTKRPTKAGLYWFNGSSPLTDEKEPTNMVFVRKVRTQLVVPDYLSQNEYALNLFNGLWHGPLTPPSISQADFQKSNAVRLPKE